MAELVWNGALEAPEGRSSSCGWFLFWLALDVQLVTSGALSTSLCSFHNSVVVSGLSVASLLVCF